MKREIGKTKEKKIRIGFDLIDVNKLCKRGYIKKKAVDVTSGDISKVVSDALGLSIGGLIWKDKIGSEVISWLIDNRYLQKKEKHGRIEIERAFLASQRDELIEEIKIPEDIKFQFLWGDKKDKVFYDLASLN